MAEHFEVDLTGKNARSEVNNIIKEALSVGKTEFESIRLEYLDADPQVASNVLDTLIVLVQEQIRSIHNNHFENSIRSVKKEMDLKRMEIDSFKNKLRFYEEEYGIVNYEVQTEELYAVYYSIKGDPKVGKKELDEVSKLIEVLKKHGGAQDTYARLSIAAQEDFISLKRHYEKLVETLEFKKIYVNVVSSATPAEKKHYPIRWLIVLSITMSSFFLALIVSYLLENGRERNS